MLLLPRHRKSSGTPWSSAAKCRLHGQRMSLLKNLVIQTPSTIHRLLGVLPNSPYFKLHSDNPLPYDILVVDEASMIDCALMAKLFSALKPNSKLIVLGDKDQLASVEAGAIMSDICDAYASRHKRTPGFCAEISKISENYGLLSDENETGLSDCIVELKKNYRFAENSGIGVVSDAIKKVIQMKHGEFSIQILSPICPYILCLNPKVYPRGYIEMSLIILPRI